MLAALLLSAPAAAVAADPAEEGGPARPWYVPDHLKLQLAGEIGFLSPGAGWELAHGRVELDLFVGWVPERLAGDDLWSTTAKVTLAPWTLPAGPSWRIQPLRAGLQSTWTFGSDYWLRQPGRYPGGYYSIPTALRTGFHLGVAGHRNLTRQRELGVYAELVAVDLLLRTWLENPREVDASDVVSLAIGTRFRF